MKNDDVIVRVLDMCSDKVLIINCINKMMPNRVDIFPEEQADGRLLKVIKFNFPIFYDDKVVDGLSWDKEGHVESVVKMSKV